jgi:hypothetical protein
MPKYEYKVVRSYGPGSHTGEDNLIEAFDEGWEFAKASDYIPDYIGRDLTHHYGFIEYILRKEIEEDNTKVAYWEELPHERGENWQYSAYRCGNCGCIADDDDNYCPYCGTEMLGVTE